MRYSRLRRRRLRWQRLASRPCGEGHLLKLGTRCTAFTRVYALVNVAAIHTGARGEVDLGVTSSQVDEWGLMGAGYPWYAGPQLKQQQNKSSRAG